MIIKNHITYHGQRFDITYQDVDSFDDLPTGKCSQVYGLCFYNGKIVVGYEINKKEWGLIGGGIKSGETVGQALVREVKEETNMQITKSWPVGFQHVMPENKYQLRYCCIVKPFGPFESDPDGDISEIKLIHPHEFTNYFPWGKIGERLLERSVGLIQEKTNEVLHN